MADYLQVLHALRPGWVARPGCETSSCKGCAWPTGCPQVLCALVSGDGDKQRWLRLVGVLPLLHRLTIGHPQDIPGGPRQVMHSTMAVLVYVAPTTAVW